MLGRRLNDADPSAHVDSADAIRSRGCCRGIQLWKLIHREHDAEEIHEVHKRSAISVLFLPAAQLPQVKSRAWQLQAPLNEQ